MSQTFFSKYLEKEYKVKGPIGKGLLTPNSTKGTFVAFAAGTGALTFMDLVALVARSCITQYRELRASYTVN